MLLAILAIKSVFLLLDPRPAYFFGDSASYLETATNLWIPPDRSFLYGFLLRQIAYNAHSLQAMVWLQVALSGIAAWLVIVALVKLFSTRFWIAALFGILCALEPLQLLIERYVMTDGCATFLFAVHLVLLLAYIRTSRSWMLVLGQALGVLLVGFRISFLPEVLVNSVLVPLLSRESIAFMRSMFKRSVEPSMKSAARLVAIHLALSLFVSLGLISCYKHWYGHLDHREPALLYASGEFLLADFAPLVEPEDFPTSARAELFSKLTIDRHDVANRPMQHFGEGGLVNTIQRMYPDPKQANDLETATALHALFRNPAGAFNLAWKTLCLYFDGQSLRQALAADEGAGQRMDARIQDRLETLYGVYHPAAFMPSMTKTWHMAAEPWYPFVLCALSFSPLLVLVARRRDGPLLLVCVVTALLFFEGAVLTVDRPTPRFLTADAWLALLMLGVLTDYLVPT